MSEDQQDESRLLIQPGQEEQMVKGITANAKYQQEKAKEAYEKASVALGRVSEYAGELASLRGKMEAELGRAGYFLTTFKDYQKKALEALEAARDLAGSLEQVDGMSGEVVQDPEEEG